MENLIGTYTEYIEKNLSFIVNEINAKFESTKEYIKAKICHTIRGYLTPLPVHYKWIDDGCLYDHSGELQQEGYINLEQTIGEFLENEYTGDKIATYESGCGFQFITYGDMLYWVTMEMGEDIMNSTVKQILQDSFHVKISDELFADIMDEIHDTIYDDSLASDFFFYEAAIEFVNIRHKPLKQLFK